MESYAYFENEIKSIKECFDIKKAFIVISKLRLQTSITDDENLINLASNFADFCYSKNNLDAKVLLYKLYFNMICEKEDLESAKIIKVVNSGLKYFKANDLSLYFLIVYLYARFSTNEKQLKKHLKVFEDSIDNDICKVFLADIYMQNNDNEKALYYLKSMRGNINSVIFFEVLYKYFLKNDCGFENVKNLVSVIKWADLHGFDTTELIKKHIDILSLYTNVDINFSLKLYNKVSDDKVLAEICKYYINKKDVSKTAFEYYKLAMKKQVEVPKLNSYFINSAFNNGYESISHYFMSIFIKNNVVDEKLKPFIYHVMIVNEHLNDILEVCISSINAFIKNSINCEVNEYIFTIFGYAILNRNKFSFTDEEFKKIENKVFENLFTYKINVESDFEEILISYKDRGGIGKYSINNGCAYITSPTPEFNYYLYDKNKNIMARNVSIKPLIYSHSIDIYLYFYEKGFYSDELYIFLANYYLEQKSSDDDVIEVFGKVLKISGISAELEKRLNTYIAQLNILKNNYEDAVQNISQINYDNISKSFLETIIEVYINAKKYSLVYEIISQMPSKVSDEIILKLAKVDDENVLKRFSQIFLDRLIFGLDDKQLFSIVLKYSEMTFDMQNSLLKKYEEYGIEEPIFVRKYVENILNKKVISAEIEKFIYDNFKFVSKKAFENYVKLLLFNVINNEYKVSEKTLSLFEGLETNLDVCLILTRTFNRLSTFDIEKVVTTIKENYLVIDNEDMLKLLENDLYFRKNKFFSYTVANANNVYICYKMNGTDNKVKMDCYGYNYYFAKVLMFFGEEVEYYFVVERASGSIETKKYQYKNRCEVIFEDSRDNYTTINNALIHHNKYQMTECEKNIEMLLKIEELDIDCLK